MNVKSIELKRSKRSGGGGQTEREYLDFMIHGVSLREMLKTTNITSLGWLPSPWAERSVLRLLGKEPSDFPDNRQSLYVCAECADLGCGAISVVVERQSDEIVWRDFGYQNSYDDRVDLESYEGVGPFRFKASAYTEAIGSATLIDGE
jgi:hypothetical protein